MPNREAIMKALQSTAEEIGPTDFGDMVSEVLNEQAEAECVEAGNHGGVIVNEPLQVEKPKASQSSEFDAVLGHSAQLRTKLQAALETQVKKRVHHRQTGVRIDGRAVHRLLTNGKVFARKTTTKQVDTALMLLLDVSGSMASDGRIETARRSAMAVAAGVTQISGCKVAAAAFPNVVVLKEFDERIRAVSGRFDIDPRGSTPMGKAMLWAAPKIAMRREQRKMLVVVTDGAPDNWKEVQDLAARYTASGVEIIGVGIANDAVKVLFRQSIVISDVAELPVAMFNLLKGSMRRVA
ncbi:von Willebrand factor, type A [mine drainage metagenome]|uniref:von Willebrand factor, type A n=2 Tax=mine drainage metagenome TaxID=410659 RepID=T1AAA9_9ZZZZ